jgi:hypothetical protein
MWQVTTTHVRATLEAAFASVTLVFFRRVLPCGLLQSLGHTCRLLGGLDGTSYIPGRRICSATVSSPYLVDCILSK